MMSKIMRRAGMKKKTVRVSNAPQRKTLRITEMEDKILKLQKEVHAVQESGEHLVFIDECVFKSRDF